MPATKISQHTDGRALCTRSATSGQASFAGDITGATRDQAPSFTVNSASNPKVRRPVRLALPFLHEFCKKYTPKLELYRAGHGRGPIATTSCEVHAEKAIKVQPLGGASILAPLSGSLN